MRRVWRTKNRKILSIWYWLNFYQRWRWFVVFSLLFPLPSLSCCPLPRTHSVFSSHFGFTRCLSFAGWNSNTLYGWGSCPWWNLPYFSFGGLIICLFLIDLRTLLLILFCIEIQVGEVDSFLSGFRSHSRCFCSFAPGTNES